MESIEEHYHCLIKIRLNKHVGVYLCECACGLLLHLLERAKQATDLCNHVNVKSFLKIKLSLTTKTSLLGLNSGISS